MFKRYAFLLVLFCWSPLLFNGPITKEALFDVVEKGNTQLVADLLSKNVLIHDDAARVAARKGYTEILEMLLDKGAPHGDNLVSMAV